jgi:flagellar hook protein FlgE
MSLMTSLYSGTTGLESNSLDLSVIGDNISNANTIGFKGSRSAFEDILSQGLIGGSQLGLGTQMQAIQKIITQGALTTTGLATDLALQGNGFFVVKGSHNGTDGQFYTRAGQFTINQQGDLVNLDGLEVQGYTADATGKVGGPLGNLAIGNATAKPNPTANIQMKGNLDANTTTKGPFDPLNPDATADFTTSVNVYDSLGNEHSVSVYFDQTSPGNWTWTAMTDGGGLTGGTAGTLTQIGTGTMTFDATGALTASTQTSTFNPLGATNPQALNFDFGSGTSGMTQFGSKSATSFINQDGYSSGTLAGVQIDASGNVVGAFTNGQSRTLGQVAVANFEAPDQLNRAGGNLFAETNTAGPANIGQAATGGRGSIVAGALEQSNVDLATEFVRMIAAQRGFQANGKTITTADSLLAELMTLKR